MRSSPDEIGTFTAGRLRAGRESLLLPAGVFILALVFYFCCAARTITRGGDCGELISDSWNLGIAHPSGYPLYLLVGRAFAALLPFLNVAWRYNLFSAVAGAAAVAILSSTCYHLLLHRGRKVAVCSAAGAALLLAGSYQFATQALIAEVYTVGALFLNVLLHCAVRWHLDDDWRWFLTLVLVTALALVTHLSCVFLLPGLYWYAMWAHRDRFKQVGFRRLPWLSAFGLVTAALCILAYLPLRSGLFPTPPRMQTMDESIYWPLDWGHPVAPADVKAHAQAKLYRSLLIVPQPMEIAGKTVNVPTFAVPPTEWPAHIADWGQLTFTGYLFSIPFIVIGALAVWRTRPLAILLAVTVLLNSLEFGYKVSDPGNFFFPVYVSVSLWLAFGLAEAAHWGSRLPGMWRWRYMTGGAIGIATTIICEWAFVGSQISWADSTISHDVGLTQARAAADLEKRYGKRAVVLLPNDDFLWGYWYSRFVEKEGGRSVTPWGRGLSRAVRAGRLPENIRDWQKTGPVAVGTILPELRSKFSFEPANSSGSLWLVRTEPLPATAVPVDGAEPLFAATFRRDPVWKPGPTGIPHVLRGGMAAVDVELTAPKQAWRKLTAADAYVEILMAEPGHYPAGGPPYQPLEEAEGKGFDKQMKVWRQRWPVVLPKGFKPGGRYRVTVPLLLQDEAVVGVYDMWTRPAWGGIPEWKWTKSDTVKVVTR